MSDVSEKVIKNIMWEELISVKDWFTTRLSLTKGRIRGVFDIDEVPHMELIMDKANDINVNEIVLRVASQTQKTTFSIGMLLYWMDTDYHDMFYMIPRAKDINKFLNFKIKPMVNGCKTVKEKLEVYSIDEKERKNSFFYKTPNNMMAVISSNDTKSITTKFGVFDEAAEMDNEIISEAKERFKDYGDEYKIIIVSTQIHEDDAINNAFRNTEIRYYRHLMCNKCNEYFLPTPNDLKIISIEKFCKDNGIDALTDDEVRTEYVPHAIKTSYIECPKCFNKITDKDKKEIIENKLAKWIPLVNKDSDNKNLLVEACENGDEKKIGFDMNSMLSKNVTISSFAEKELECRLEKNHHKKIEMYKKYYVGWWNMIYQTALDDRVDKSDILLLCNEYNEFEVPDNVSHLHLGVDLQLNRLYYMIVGVHYKNENDKYGDSITLSIVAYGELINNVDDDDFNELEKIIFNTYYNKDGDGFNIKSVGCDFKGFSKTDKHSRSSKMIDFIHKITYNMKQSGVLNYNDFIHPTVGVEKFNKINDEVNGYSIKPIKTNYNNDEMTVKYLYLSNYKLKTIVQNMIKISIENKKDDAKYENNLLHITKKALEEYEYRQTLPYSQRLEKHSLEAHLTSEVFSNIDENGKMLKEGRYIKKYQSVRNDYLDTLVSCIAQIFLYKTHKHTKAIHDNTYSYIEDIKNYF